MHMEMDVYDHKSYRMSIGNLMMLKIFHDEGVDVSKFANFVTHISYDPTTSQDIFWDGIQLLFNQVDIYEYPESGKNFNARFGKVIYDDGQYPEPELIYTFQDPIFETVLRGPYKNQYKEKFSSVSQLAETDAELVLLPDDSGIACLYYFPSHLHELVLAINKLKKEAIRLNKLAEKEKDYGYRNQFFDRESA